MRPEEQLQVIDALADAAQNAPAREIRKDALTCLVAFGIDGLSRIIDLIDETKATLESRHDAVHALGYAFAEGKVDKSGLIKTAIHALESCLTKEELRDEAIHALGEIGSQAITAKPKLMALLDAQRGNHKTCVKIGEALLLISPVN